jgi:hypothetical protein
MTEREILKWIKTNLGFFILQAIWEAKRKNEGLIYTSELITAINMRETGEKIGKLLGKDVSLAEMHGLMKGDYNKRTADPAPCYHGFHYMQIDVGSFPDFVHSGDWKDPLKGYQKAIQVLEGKRIYLQSKLPHLEGEDLLRAVVAAYNCGEGRIVQVVHDGKDIDAYTYQHNYSKEVFRYRELYRSIA